MAEARKVRVLHIITRLDPGGPTSTTLETVARLDRSVYEVDLVTGRTSDPAGQAAEFIQSRGLRCVFLPDLVRPVSVYRDLVALFKLFDIIRKGHYDIVHTHCSKAGILGRCFRG